MTPLASRSAYRLHAPAKLNLCLELLGRTEDGYHSLRTLMATIGLCDTLFFEPLGEGSLELALRGDPRLIAGVPTGPDNLVIRALALLREETGVRQGARVTLVKRVPSQAGLGGGSSDAAAALVLGARAWEQNVGPERLGSLGTQLGSDVPFFVAALTDRRTRAAIATGRGEVVRPTPAAGGQPVVVVHPEVGLSTARVYGLTDCADFTASEGPDRTAATAEALRRGRLDQLANSMTNALEKAAGRLSPVVQRLRELFASCGCRAHQLTGSGSAYFGLFATMSEARRVAATLRALRVGKVGVTTIA